jgi:uncharacterized membrane protein
VAVLVVQPQRAALLAQVRAGGQGDTAASLALRGEAAAGKTSGEAMDAVAKLVTQLPAGIGYQWSGTSYEEIKAGAQAPMVYAISVLFVFLCLAALYASWSLPFTVLLVVPLGVIGALAATSLRGLSNDVYFQTGLVATIGLSAKYAILIVEFAKKLHLEGLGLHEATLQAVRIRLRPSLMTSLTFMMGVMPLAVSTGAGSGSRIALGAGVFGGMLTATFLASFFVPMFFIVVQARLARASTVTEAEVDTHTPPPAPHTWVARPDRRVTRLEYSGAQNDLGVIAHNQAPADTQVGQPPIELVPPVQANYGGRDEHESTLQQLEYVPQCRGKRAVVVALRQGL